MLIRRLDLPEGSTNPPFPSLKKVNNKQMSITISNACAKWIVNTCTKLVSHVFALEYNPATGLLEGTESDLGDTIYDRLDHEDHELMYWADSLISFAKTMAGIVAHELAMNENIEEFPSLLDGQEEDEI